MKDGRGGWGVYLIFPDQRPDVELYDGERETTISRMELKAMLNALQLLCEHARGEEALVYSDSAYVVNGLNDHYDMWKRTNWRTSANAPVKHQDLWKPLVKLWEEAGCIEVRWVKGHSGNAGNDRADELALMGRQTLG
jgi:ribonuclease HI